MNEASQTGVRVRVAVQTPAHSGISEPLTYITPSPVPAGALVRVPLGQREVLGVVWGEAGEEPAGTTLRAVAAVLEGLPPLSAGWRDLVEFAARYYQRAIGEVALAGLPPQLRELGADQLARRLARQPKAAAAPVEGDAPRPPTAEQAAVLAELRAGDAGVFLLHGSTGSGKTEVYLQAVAELLEADPEAQALVMVPEINLTPQLEARFVARFAPVYGPGAVVSMHSGMTNPQRLASWLAAHLGRARIVLGTRMAIFASLPRLALLVVDEEHDPSYKQQEGARYSARDLAVWRGRREGARVLLGSATPSLESWWGSRPPSDGDAGGRYRRLSMPSRVGAGDLPTVRLVDMNLQPPRTRLSAALVDAIAQRVARGEQSMLLLNRRGYAPVLACGDCGWKSECPHCSAYRVFHKIDRSLRCHHCGFAERVPRACPACGNLDIAPVGRGTERLEEELAELLAGVQRPEGEGGGPVRIARIDADSTRHEGALAQQLAQVHDGAVDVLVGTQMIAKGHDFRRITLVAAINPDGALFSSDFRAPERLFSLLMQSGGRAGRDSAWLAAQGSRAEMWIQSFHPQHPLFAALRRHDYAAFAEQQLEERRAASLPPFAFQALLRADARTQEAAQAFLTAASAAVDDLPEAAAVQRYPAVPLAIQRVANVERAQMLVESESRVALQRLLTHWHPRLHALRRGPEGQGIIRWLIDVDPQAI
ncbi:replication restart DNA helicase PriA [Pseudacidovorax intermedius]|uniref:Replication restart protein PriA n=1 Tax=Pseudacidovorax intermedius TaxID=433924 RepID=A0A370FP84_9BURK|nr:primosomal protein N' [Pseudacidovorax intermedius]RDI29546.1 replication restart DNA helicase PriA [Pseudacidovorax intermedius]